MHTLKVPAIVNTSVRPSILRHEALVISNCHNRLLISPRPMLLRRCRQLVDRRVRLDHLTRSSIGLPTRLGDNRHVGIVLGTNLDPRRRRGLNDHVSNVNLCHARVPFVLRDNFPSRRRRITRCRKVLRVFGSGPIALHALSIKTSGRLPCVPVDRRGPYLN